MRHTRNKGAISSSQQITVITHFLLEKAALKMKFLQQGGGEEKEEQTPALLTKILLESLSRPFKAVGSSPIFGWINFASLIIPATSSRPSFLIFQFLSPILETNSEVILSLKNRRHNL